MTGAISTPNRNAEMITRRSRRFSSISLAKTMRMARVMRRHRRQRRVRTPPRDPRRPSPPGFPQASANDDTAVRDHHDASHSAATSCMTWLENSTQRPAARSRRIVAQHAHGVHVEPVGRLVEDDVRGSCTSARAIAVFIRSPCEKPWRAGLRPRRAPARDQRVGAAVQLHARQPVQLAEVANVLAAGQCAYTSRAHAAARRAIAALAAVAARIEAVDDCAARIRPHHSAQHPQRGRLAGAVVAEQPGDLAVARLERHVTQGLHGAEFLAQRFDTNHGAVALRDNMNGVGPMLRTQASSRSADVPAAMKSAISRGMQPVANCP